MPDFTVTRCRNKFQRNECITSSGKEGQNYFTMLVHYKREISFYTGVRSSLFLSHCSVSDTSSVSSNSKATDSRACKYEKFRFNGSFDRGSKKKLQWWVKKLQLTKGKTLINSQPQITISTDACLEGWGTYCQGQKKRAPWTSQERKDHINVLELRAVKNAILTSSRLHPKAQSIHFQMNSIVGLSYLVKMGGT